MNSAEAMSTSNELSPDDFFDKFTQSPPVPEEVSSSPWRPSGEA